MVIRKIIKLMKTPKLKSNIYHPLIHLHKQLTLLHYTIGVYTKLRSQLLKYTHSPPPLHIGTFPLIKVRKHSRRLIA